MAHKKLSQILAVEHPLKQKANAEGSELYKDAQKADLFDGHTRTYQPIDDSPDQEQLAPDNKRLQMKANNLLRKMSGLHSELIDITASKDYGNTIAKADVVVDGKTLVAAAPVPHLLFLQKQMNDWKSFIQALPTLDPAEEWFEDSGSQGQYRTNKITTARNVKVTEVQVVVQPTKEHPAQCKEFSKDKLTGHWLKTRFSGALTEDRKKTLMDTAESVSRAVKEAIQEANSEKVEEKKIGSLLFDFLLG